MFRLRISRYSLPNGGGGGACFWNPGGNRSRGVDVDCQESFGQVQDSLAGKAW